MPSHQIIRLTRRVFSLGQLASSMVIFSTTPAHGHSNFGVLTKSAKWPKCEEREGSNTRLLWPLSWQTAQLNAFGQVFCFWPVLALSQCNDHPTHPTPSPQCAPTMSSLIPQMADWPQGSMRVDSWGAWPWNEKLVAKAAQNSRPMAKVFGKAQPNKIDQCLPGLAHWPKQQNQKIQLTFFKLN